MDIEAQEFLHFVLQVQMVEEEDSGGGGGGMDAGGETSFQEPYKHLEKDLQTSFQSPYKDLKKDRQTNF